MNFLKRLFKRNNKIADLNLSLLDYAIIYPNNDFYNIENNILLYKNYNDKYKEILSNRCKTSVDLKLDNIDLNMYVNIITKLTIELHNISDVLNQNEDRNNINLNIIINKLNYYKNLLSEYKNKSFIKLKVLEDILKKKLLFHSKRNIMESEISNLKGKILICQNNISGIEKELNYYYNFSSDNIPKVDNEKEYLSSIYNMDHKFASMLKLNIENKENISLSDICAIEISIENYLYKNKKSLVNLKQEYNNLLNSDIERNIKLKRVSNLIDKYMLINRFYKEEDTIFLNELLELKFNTIEEDYLSNGEPFIDKYSYKREVEYFENKMLDKIMQITKYKYKEISHKYHEYYNEIKNNNTHYDIISAFYEEFIQTFNNVITTKDNNYNIKEILKSPLFSALILSMSEPQNLTAYFRNFEVKREECKDINFYDEIFDWHDKVPVDTIARLIYENYVDLGVTKHQCYSYPIKINKQLHYLFILHYIYIKLYSSPGSYTTYRKLQDTIDRFYRMYANGYSPDFEDIWYHNTLYRGVNRVKKRKYLKDFSFVFDPSCVHFDTSSILTEKEQTTIRKLIRKKR